MILGIYRLVFLFTFVNMIMALWCIFAPFDWAAHTGVGPMTWTSANLFRIWGGTLLGVHVLYIPGLIDPLRYQWSNWTSIALKFWMSLIFITSGFDFYKYAAWDFICGAVLLILWLLVLSGRKEMKFMNA